MERSAGSSSTTPRATHPALQALMQSLSARPPASPSPRAALSSSGGNGSVSGHPGVSLRALPQQSQLQLHSSTSVPRRQSSAAMRRKLRSLEAAHLPLSPAHAAAHSDVHVAATPAAATAAASGINLPPSLLPPAARVYSRAPLAPFAAGLSQSLGQASLTGGLPSGAQWEQLVFPSANPLADGSGEGEVRRLAAWFDAAWAQLEQGVQAQAERERQQQVRMADAKARALRIEQLSGGIVPAGSATAAADAEKGDGSLLPSVVPASLTPALLRQLDESRSRLVFIVFHELLRHVTALCRRRGALLEKVWGAQARLADNRTKHRLTAALSSAAEHSARHLDSLSNQHAAAVRAEQSASIHSSVELNYLSAELEAKDRIIGHLQEENDKDLLFSNRTLCHKELALLRLQRSLAQVEAERSRAEEQAKYGAEDKAQLEASLAQVEEERDELNAQCLLLQELLEQRARPRASVQSQYDPDDLPPEPSAAQAGRERAATRVQSLFRGFRTRRRLKMHGLLSRKLILQRLHHLRLAATGAGAAFVSGGMAGGSGAMPSGGVGGSGGGSMPSIPRAFLHLLDPMDMALRRPHFVRTFARKNLLKWISSLYDEKAYHDYTTAARSRSHGLARAPLKEFAEFIYDLYLLRHGSRDAAEMDLLDLFASVEKHVATSARVRLFSMLINNACRHRKLLPAGDHHAAASQSHADGGGAAARPRAQHHMSEQERTAHELKCRLTVSLHGGRNLNARVLDFLLRFRALAKEAGRGPFQSVGDNHDGVAWIHMHSLVDMFTRCMHRLPPFLLAAAVTKMQHRADSMRGAEAGAGAVPTSAAAAAAASRSSTAPSPAPSPSPSSAASASAAAAASRFVDLDSMIEVVVETYIDEDARMDAALLDVFRHPNPALCVQQQRERMLLRQRGDFAEGAAAAAAQAVPSQATSSVDADACTGANGISSTEAGAVDSEQLEPEMYSFMHYSTVLRALGIPWDEERLLRAYQQAVQRAVGRPVAMADFVATTRCYGVMPVEVEWERVEAAGTSGGGGGGEAGAGGEDPAMTGAAGVDVELPPLEDDAALQPQGDLLERRLQELKDKMRETEAIAHSKQEHASRRHERELSQLRQSHEREIEALNQMHLNKIEAQKRAHEHALLKAAADYNALFESSGSEVQQLKQIAESSERKQKEHAAATTKHFTNKLLEEERAISLLQSKLASKNEKYKRTKAALAALQQRLQQAEGDNKSQDRE